MDAHITIDNLVFRRGDRQIFDQLSLKIPRGSITALMGPSGTGKTTFLRLIGGQLVPHQGTIKFGDTDVHKLNRSDLYELRKRMGMLFQSGALLTDLNVFENVAFPLREHTALNEDMLRDLVLMKLQAVGLRGAADLMPAELSGGMARRVALARSIALDPEFMMYDEPFTGLDPITLGTIVTLIKRLNRSLGITSLVVTHDIHEIMSIADYAAIISDGKVVEAGTPEQLNASESPWIQQFLQGEADGPAPFHFPANNYQETLMGASHD